MTNLRFSVIVVAFIVSLLVVLGAVSAVIIPDDGAPPPASPGSSQACGNNLKEGTEQCDHGNINSGDGCSSICLV